MTMERTLISIAILLAILLAVAAARTFATPLERHCPEPGWYLNGVRPSGAYQCLPVLGDPERDLDDARERRVFADERALEGRIHCTGGARPIVVDYRTVGCQR